MATHGGARPGASAPVSGPGALSQRTDGAAKMDLPDAEYGEAAAFDEIQSGAPLGGGSGLAAPSSGGGDPLAALTSMGAPTGDPNMPITEGADAGPGAGMEALGVPLTPQQERRADVARMHPGMVQALLVESMRAGAPDSLKRLVRTVLANTEG